MKKIIEKLKGLNAQQLYICIVSAVILLMILYYMIFINPIFKKFTVYSSKISELKKVEQEAEFFIANLDNWQRQTELLKKQYEYFNHRLSIGSDISSLLSYISKVSKETDINIKRMEPDTSKLFIDSIEKLYSPMKIYIKATGGFHQLGKFINRLERADYLISIENISLFGNGLPTNPQHDIELIVNAFVLTGK